MGKELPQPKTLGTSTAFYHRQYGDRDIITKSPQCVRKGKGKLPSSTTTTTITTGSVWNFSRNFISSPILEAFRDEKGILVKYCWGWVLGRCKNVPEELPVVDTHTYIHTPPLQDSQSPWEQRILQAPFPTCPWLPLPIPK